LWRWLTILIKNRGVDNYDIENSVELVVRIPFRSLELVVQPSAGIDMQRYWNLKNVLAAWSSGRPILTGSTRKGFLEDAID
jgi:hypothetical protein